MKRFITSILVVVMLGLMALSAEAIVPPDGPGLAGPYSDPIEKSFLYDVKGPTVQWKGLTLYRTKNDTYIRAFIWAGVIIEVKFIDEDGDKIPDSYEQESTFFGEGPTFTSLEKGHIY
jgi:hypothetical protein